jgi:hypothetical protein
VDLLLCDETLGLGLPDFRLALVIGEDHANLRALKAGHAFEALVEGQGDVDLTVGDIAGNLVDHLVFEPREGRRARQRVDHSDDDLLGLRDG